MESEAEEKFREELELIQSSLLSTERLLISSSNSSSSPSLIPYDPSRPLPPSPMIMEINSSTSTFSVKITLSQYPPSISDDIHFQIRSSEMDREEAQGWAHWVEDVVQEGWEEASDSSLALYTLLVTHFLPLLQSKSGESSAQNQDLDPQSSKQSKDTQNNHDRSNQRPTQVLFTSHHLLAPSKRRDLSSLSSSLGLYGFAKTGYPGIIFALCPSAIEADEFVREVKRWQWLALKLRSVEEVKQGDELVKSIEREAGEGKKWKGRWEEVDSLGLALEWMRKAKRQYLLTDIGYGGGGAKSKEKEKEN